MQEEINQKTFVLTFKAAKLTGRVLRAAIRAFLRKMKEVKNDIKHPNPQSTVKHGKQKLKTLQAQNQELMDVEITEDNIKSFEKSARKYNIDYCLKADKSQDPPQWYVFFKARDKNILQLAFKDYVADGSEHKKESVREKLNDAQETIKKTPLRERAKQILKNRSETL